MSNCKVIALTNQKGGVGKTTTAVNLGVSLANQGKKVLLIDADAQANLTMSLGYSRPDDLPVTLSTIMQDMIDDKPVDVSKGILHHGEGVDLLPSNIELSGLEVRLINAISRESVLKACVNEVKKNYDYVLVDCMPSLGMLTINALAAADSVVIPTQPHYLSAKGLELLLRSVSKVRRQINPHLRIDGILMTMVMPRTNISKEVTALVKIDDKPVDVSKGILHHGEGVDLLPSNIELSGLEVRLINAISRESVLKACVNEVKKNYDYVLVDCMPSLGMLTINALAAADSVVIPTQPHYLSAKGLELLLRSVSKVRRQINPHLRIDGILMTMVMPRTNISKEVTALVKSAYGQKIKVFDAQIPHSIRAVEATAEGKSIFAYDKSGKVAVAYEQLGKEVAELGEKQRKQNRADRIR